MRNLCDYRRRLKSEIEISGFARNDKKVLWANPIDQPGER